MSAPYMPLYIADYLADTTHLTRSEHGAYLLLLMAMWRGGGKLPTDDAKLARLAKCSSEEWDGIRDVIMDFFKRRGGTMTHKRLSAEYTKYENTLKRKSEGGKASAAKKAKQNNDNAGKILDDNHQDIATNQNQNQNHKEEDADTSASAPVVFVPTLETDDWPAPAETAKALAETAKLSSAQWQLLTASELLAWRRNGFSYLLDIVPTVTAVAGRAKRPPGSWSYFTPAIAQNHANRLKNIDLPEAQNERRNPDNRDQSAGRSTDYMREAIDLDQQRRSAKLAGTG